MRRRHLGVAVVFALGLTVAACADGDDPDTDPDTDTDAERSDSLGDDATVTDAQSEDADASNPGAGAVSFASTVDPVTAADLGASWTEGLGCAPPEELVAVTVSHHGFDDSVHQGRIVVAESVAQDVVAVFADLFDAGFPIERMEPVSVFDGDDDASMAANNSSGYNCRPVAGTTSLSKHAFGLAIDINPLLNPWVHDGRVDPAEGAAYTDRSRTDPGIIHAGDIVVQAFAARGWEWGGDWTNPDYQHFYVDG